MTPRRTPAATTTGRPPSRRAPGPAGTAAHNGTGRATVRNAGRRPATTGAERIREAPRARGERTRGRVADALIALLREGDPAPTAKSVAERASVSVRLVFHHFDDMETLYLMALAVQADRHWRAVREVGADRPVDERIDRTVAQRAKLFDAVGPVLRASGAMAARNTDIADAVAESDRTLRSWVAATFSPELGAVGPERRDLLDAIDAAASWEAWERLRRTQHLSVAAARRAMRRTLAGLLTA